MIKNFRRIISDFKEYFIVVILIVISLSLLSINENQEIKRLRAYGFGAFAIINSGLNSFVSLFRSSGSVEEFKKENARLTLEVNKLRKQGLENENLRSMLSFKNSEQQKLISANIVSKLVTKAQGSFIINRGLSDGIEIGMPALTDKGLVGIVVDVADDFCLIRTLYNTNLNLAVTIQRINVDGILNWNGNELHIKNIPTTYDVKVGDRIETSNFSTLLPPAIPIGIVAEKESNVLGLLHSISIKPFVDINSVNDLFILKIIPSKQIDQLEMNLLRAK